MFGLRRDIGMNRGEFFSSLIDVLFRRGTFFECVGGGEDIGSFVCELVLKVFGSEDRDFREEEFSFDRFRASVIEDCPNGNLGNINNNTSVFFLSLRYCRC